MSCFFDRHLIVQGRKLPGIIFSEMCCPNTTPGDSRAEHVGCADPRRCALPVVNRMTCGAPMHGVVALPSTAIML
jgi:hypothetical protein